MKVLVNGIGNIGVTVLNLLLRYKNNLGIKEIHACKNSIHPWNEVERNHLEESGVKICTTSINNQYPIMDYVLSSIDYIFETTSNGIGLQNLENYKKYKNLKASAQGSEKGFGTPFMSGVNDEKILNDQFVTIVSCNTHGTASLLTTFAGNKLENLKEADVVVVRRSEDIGNHERLVSGNVVARHLHSEVGTHHGVDIVDLFKTINVTCELTSSDITTPSQLMHAVRFNIKLIEPLTNSISELIQNNIFLSETRKFDSNVIFELGRRYGIHGRIYSHAIIVSENILHNDKCTKGWAFVPQEGNSILSTIHAFLLQTNSMGINLTVFEKIKKDLLKKEW